VELVGPPSIDWLGVPLRVRDRTIGAVVVQSYSAGVRHTDADKDLLAFVSSHVALAIERQRTGEELRESGERYRSFIEHSTEAVWRFEIDPPCPLMLPAEAQIEHFYQHARVAECNDTMARTYGRGAAREMLGARPGDLLVRTDPRNDESFRAFIHAGYRLTDAETHERDAAGRSKVFLNNYIGIVADGHLVRIWGTQRDVTEQRRLEEQFRQVQKMEAVGQLAGGIAHDFNNILTAILGTGQLLLRDMPPDDPLREDVEEIRRAALRAADLTRQLLAYSRRQILAPKVLDLNVIVSGLGPMLRRLLGEDVQLTTTLAPDLGPVRADPGQVEQVIVNLAVNARDAMPGGGRLSLTTGNEILDAASVRDHAGAAPGPYAVLATSDNGTGMAAEVRSHLFEPFFTTKEVGKGTGLGLATVYGIVRQSGGFISVKTELGEGSTFRVYLPRVDAVVQAGEDPGPPQARVGGAETILLVEDEEAVRNLGRRGLAAEGYTVITAGNAVQAVEALERCGGPIHLLVTDLVMPGMGGRELAQRLTRVRPTLRVLYISGYSSDAVAKELILQKPFTPDDLARRVREVLDGRPADLALAGAEPPPSTAS
jgi:signal transduction histidine kinase/CheY-like chemotaxis protein